jgi:tetratricopeptide (TPR) repeat protein
LGQYQRAIDFHQQSLEIKREIGDLSGKANSYWNLSSICQQRGRLKRAIHYRHQAYCIWQDMNLSIEATPLPNIQKRLLADMRDNWAEQLIASEQMMAWLLIPMGYLQFAIRTLLSPLTFLQKKLKIKSLWFWLGLLLAIALLIYWLKR